MTSWWVFRNGSPHREESWPEAPPWRRFDGPVLDREPPPEVRDDRFKIRLEEEAGKEVIDLVNAAIHLRRPLLVTGYPGTGKSSLARAIAWELQLGRLLVWPINSRSTRQEGLYLYDAIRRLQDISAVERAGTEQAPSLEIGKYVTLGALGTALLPSKRPRVLLIDEIDKSDIDLPNDLLHLFEEGEFHIPELVRDGAEAATVRTADGDEVVITKGRVRCNEFPIVILTSNGEREFPAAFKRRCLRVNMPQPSKEWLRDIVMAKFGPDDAARKAALEAAGPLIEDFINRRGPGELATDQLLNAIRMATSGAGPVENKRLHEALLRSLSGDT